MPADHIHAERTEREDARFALELDDSQGVLLLAAETLGRSWRKLATTRCPETRLFSAILAASLSINVDSL
jgi:hypothetical protein